MTPLSIPGRSGVLRIFERAGAVVDRRFRYFAALLVAATLVYAVAEDVRSRMWLDELFTLHIARQASQREIVRATLEGCDGAPPLYAMLVHAMLPVIPHDALAVRLPSTLGYCAMLLCLLIFCRRRLPATYALVAGLLACNSSLAYATQGRAYGLVLGCAGGALLAWQAAVGGRRRAVALPLLALCLALMTALHYYAVFFLIPLSLAELVRWRKSGKLDVAMFAAMAPVPLVLALHYPLIAAGRHYLAHYWARTNWHSIPAVYSDYWAVLPTLAVLVVAWLAPQDRTAPEANLTIPEWAASAAFAVVPLGVILLSKYTTHIFVPRYTVWAVTGVAVLAAALLCGAARGTSAVGVSALLLLTVLLARQAAPVLWSRPVLLRGEEVRRELETLPQDSEPIVVANHHVFMELSYYASSRIRARLVFPLNRTLDLRYTNADTGALLLAALRKRVRLPIEDYDAVLAAHPRFLLAAIPGDYLPWHLVRTGYHVVPVSSRDEPLLFQVQAPGRE